MASGIFIVPLLILVDGMEIHTAVAASLVSVIACSCGSAAPFLAAALTNIRIAIVLETATTVGALSGVFLTGILPVSVLYLVFAAVLLLSARQMMLRRRDPQAGPEEAGSREWATILRLQSSYPDPALGRDVFYRVRRLPLGLALMYCAGMLSALLGIGSGVLKIPAMDTALRLPIKVSSATSNFMIGGDGRSRSWSFFRAGRDRCGDRRAGGAGVRPRGLARGPPPDGDIRREAPVYVRRGARRAGGANDAQCVRDSLGGARRMTADLARPPRLERLVARLLSCGTGLAAGVIALGLMLQFLGWPQGVRVVTIGVALFVLLPVLRVLLMLVVFCLDGDYRFCRHRRLRAGDDHSGSRIRHRIRPSVPTWCRLRHDEE